MLQSGMFSKVHAVAGMLLLGMRVVVWRDGRWDCHEAAAVNGVVAAAGAGSCVQ